MLKGMLAERLKLKSGLCRIVGRYQVTKQGAPEQCFDGPLTILAAFDGDTIRFDRTQPGWVLDPATTRPHPDGEGRAAADMKRGVERQLFYDTGKKAAYWHEDSPHIEVLPSLGDARNPFSIRFFDVRGLGVYSHMTMERQLRLRQLFAAHDGMKNQPKVNRTDPDTWLLESQSIDGPMEARTSMSVEVRKGFTPVKYSVRVRSLRANTGWHIQDERSTQWEERNGVWLPVRHESTASPGPESWREVITFTATWDNVNEPIDPSLFDYRNFGAPDHVGVVDSSLGKPITVKPSAVLPAQPSLWKRAALVALGLLAVGGMIWFVRDIVRRRTGLAGGAE